MLARYGIHAGQDVLLYYLSQEDGQTVSKLVEAISIQHATISHMITRMVANGLVIKAKDEKDMRVSRIFLTDKGREAYQEVERVWKNLEVQSAEGFSSDDKILLKDLLQRVLNNFD